MLPNYRHWFKCQVLLAIKYQPGGALRQVVEGDGEGDDGHQAGETQPVPGQVGPEGVAEDQAAGCHDLIITGLETFSIIGDKVTEYRDRGYIQVNSSFFIT